MVHFASFDKLVFIHRWASELVLGVDRELGALHLKWLTTLSNCHLILILFEAQDILRVGGLRISAV